MCLSKHSEDDGHDATTLGTGCRKESNLEKARQKKIANKIITYRRRKDMIYVGIDLHKKNTQGSVQFIYVQRF